MWSALFLNVAYICYSSPNCGEYRNKGLDLDIIGEAENESFISPNSFSSVSYLLSVSSRHVDYAI